MEALLDQLNAFDRVTRDAALRKLLAMNPERPPVTDRFNMHLHSFFSFNGEGYSPSRLAWEARQRGLYALAICDFDVLQGLDELLSAADLLQVRAAVGFESRTYFAEYADDVINSPGEPGVFYFMGMGFVSEPAPDTPAGRTLADMLERSHNRNRRLIGRINAQLQDVCVDYERDVIPLTPDRNATERHIVHAYYQKALDVCGGAANAALFWADVLGLDQDDARAQIETTNAFSNTLRSKLMKKGGMGYTQPTPKTFPRLDDVIRMIIDSRAIPMSTWLDGTSEGERDPDTQLALLMEKGIEAVNIIPDRNWNISDADEKARKIREFDAYVAAARRLDLPINVGTELNKPGQRFVDDFDAPPMARHHEVFLEGARIMVGHTCLLRYANVSYIGEEAKGEFPERRDRNRFFAAVGALPVPGPEVRDRLEAMDNDRAYSVICDAAGTGAWR